MNCVIYCKLSCCCFAWSSSFISSVLLAVLWGHPVSVHLLHWLKCPLHFHIFLFLHFLLFSLLFSTNDVCFFVSVSVICSLFVSSTFPLSWSFEMCTVHYFILLKLSLLVCSLFTFPSCRLWFSKSFFCPANEDSSRLSTLIFFFRCFAESDFWNRALQHSGSPWHLYSNRRRKLLNYLLCSCVHLP